MAFLQYLPSFTPGSGKTQRKFVLQLIQQSKEASSPLYACGSWSRSAKVGDISIEIAAEMRAVGGHDLPQQEKCLERRDVIQMLESHPRTHDRIPTGVKDDVYFKVDKRNLERRRNRLCSQFWDDCGAWVSGPSNTDMFVRLAGNTLTPVVAKNGQYRTTSYRRTDDGRQHILAAFDKQPGPEDVIHLHRAYSTHTLDANYKRRIPWMEHERLQSWNMWEHGAPYGRGGNDTEFIRTEPIVIDYLRAPRVESAKETWRDVEGKFEIGGLRSQKQVENAKCRAKKADQKTSSNKHNFSDQIQTLQTLVTTHEFVQVSLSKEKVPTIILFTEEQIMDVNRFCCSAPVAHTTVLVLIKHSTLESYTSP